MIKKIIAAVAVLFGISACTPQDDFKQPNVDVHKCQNTFVVSGGDYTYLFEHDDNSVNFHLVRRYKYLDNAFYDCKRDELVGHWSNHVDPYSGGKPKEGIAIYGISSGDKFIYPTNQLGFNSIPIRYKNGLIYTGSSINKIPLSSYPKGSYIPARKLKGNDGKWYAYPCVTKFFDLDKREFTHTYKYGIYGPSKLIGDVLYTYAGDHVKIDLRTGKAEALREDPSDKKLWWPANSQDDFVGDADYCVTNEDSYNDVSGDRTHPTYKLKNFIDHGLYRLKDKKQKLMLELPVKNIYNFISIKDKTIYLYSSTLKVYKYDIASNKIIKIYDISHIRPGDEYTEFRIGYTEDNFILLFGSNIDSGRGKVIITNRDFTKFSKAYNVNSDEDFNSEALKAHGLL